MTKNAIATILLLLLLPAAALAGYCEELQARLDAATIEGPGTTIRLQDGTFHCSKALTVRGKSVHLVGEGATTLAWGQGAESAGIVYEGASQAHHRFSIRGVKLVTTTGYRFTALRASWPAAGSAYDRSFSAERVEILGQWGAGIWLSDAWHATIRDALIRDHQMLTSIGYGILLDGHSTAAWIGGNRIYFVNHGIATRDLSEESHVSDNTIVWARVGVSLGPSDGSSVRNNHIAAGSAGIVASRQAQAWYVGNQIYRREDMGDLPFVGVQLSGSAADSHVTDNVVYAFGAPSRSNGIVLGAGVCDVHVTGNRIVSAWTGVWLQAGTARILTRDNTLQSGGPSVVVNHGSGNLIRP